MSAVAPGAGRYDRIHGDESWREDPELDRAEATIQYLLATVEALANDHKSREHDEELCLLCQMVDAAIAEAQGKP